MKRRVATQHRVPAPAAFPHALAVAAVLSLAPALASCRATRVWVDVYGDGVSRAAAFDVEVAGNGQSASVSVPEGDVAADILLPVSFGLRLPHPWSGDIEVWVRTIGGDAPGAEGSSGPVPLALHDITYVTVTVAGEPIPPGCGDGVLDGPTELCDGADLGGETCVTLGMGFDAGVLACGGNCMSWDLSGCSECGNDVREGEELCDGDDLGGTDCQSLGTSFIGGTLMCASTCRAFDTTACDPAECSDPGDCDDGNPCTDESCPAGLCVSNDNTSPCDDGDFCTVGDACSGGLCLPTGVMACGAGEVCDSIAGMCVCGPGLTPCPAGCQICCPGTVGGSCGTCGTSVCNAVGSGWDCNGQSGTCSAGSSCYVASPGDCSFCNGGTGCAVGQQCACNPDCTWGGCFG